ncbi:hypothetical protein AB0I60_32115 [Actinosynnema sp. NPDC050436]|uniref:hypothetical protein n=1 Tax=Actinosynnema sp. NPDC050436 TaxID=3155659 RepID=UPI0034086AC0
MVPGALWVRDAYVDPVTGSECDSLALSSPAMATLDPEEVRRLWPVTEQGATRSTLAVLGASMTAVVVELEPAGRLVESEAFRASPTPVVVLPVPMFSTMIESAVFVVSSVGGLDEKFVLSQGALLPLPPVVIEGGAARWLVSPDECDGLMSGPELARLLVPETPSVERVPTG